MATVSRHLRVSDVGDRRDIRRSALSVAFILPVFSGLALQPVSATPLTMFPFSFDEAGDSGGHIIGVAQSGMVRSAYTGEMRVRHMATAVELSTWKVPGTAKGDARLSSLTESAAGQAVGGRQKAAAPQAVFTFSTVKPVDAPYADKGLSNAARSAQSRPLPIVPALQMGMVSRSAGAAFADLPLFNAQVALRGNRVLLAPSMDLAPQVYALYASVEKGVQAAPESADVLPLAGVGAVSLPATYGVIGLGGLLMATRRREGCHV